MGKSKQDGLLSCPEIWSRGWSDPLIDKFLGIHDGERVNPFYDSASPMRLYKVSRVKAAERTKKFQAALQKVEKRRETHRRKQQALGSQEQERFHQEQEKRERQRLAELRRLYYGYSDCFASRYQERGSDLAMGAAAAARFELNRHAKESGAPRTEIYAIKNRVLKLFWELGYCYGADLAESPASSWGTIPGKKYWALRFQIGERIFSWHLPIQSAPWASRRGEPQPHLVLAEIKEVDFSSHDVKESLALLYWILGDLGIPCCIDEDETKVAGDSPVQAPGNG